MPAIMDHTQTAVFSVYTESGKNVLSKITDRKSFVQYKMDAVQL